MDHLTSRVGLATKMHHLKSAAALLVNGFFTMHSCVEMLCEQGCLCLGRGHMIRRYRESNLSQPHVSPRIHRIRKLMPGDVRSLSRLRTLRKAQHTMAASSPPPHSQEPRPLHPKPSTLNPPPLTLHPQPSTSNPPP